MKEEEPCGLYFSLVRMQVSKPLASIEVNDSDYAAGPVHVFHNNNGAHKVLQHSSLPFQTFYALSSVISLPFGLGENAAVHTCQNM